MMELRRGRVLERVKKACIAIFDRYQAVTHQRIFIVQKSGIHAGNQRAGKDGHEHQRQRAAGMASRQRGAAIADIKRGPQQQHQNDQRHAKMHGKAVLRDRGVCRQPRFHHPPADHPLKAAKGEKREQPATEPVGDIAPDDQHEERNGECQAEETAPQTMKIFPEEDRLEPGKIHAVVELVIFRRGEIEFIDALPFGRAQWRQGAHQRPPFDHRKPASRQARHSADQHHYADQRGHGDQPPEGKAVGSRAKRGTVRDFCCGHLRQHHAGSWRDDRASAQPDCVAAI